MERSGGQIQNVWKTSPQTGLQILQIRGIQIMELRIKEVLHLHERKIQEKSKQYHNLVQNRISLNNQNQLSIFCIWNYNT